MVGSSNLPAPTIPLNRLAAAALAALSRLGLVHAIAFLDKRGKHEMPVYSDSETALAWLRAGRCRTKQPRSVRNAPVFDLIARAEKWLAEHEFTNPVLKWQTDKWGEIPADYGRK